jgi:hypothetical protein
MLKCRLVLLLALAASLASNQESSLGSQPKAGAKPAAAHPPNNLVGQVAAVNAATFPGSIDVHPGYTIVRPQITYRYVITKNTKIIASSGGIASLNPGLTVAIHARNGVALTIQVIGYVQ